MIEKIIILLIFGLIAMMFFGNRLPQVLGDLGKGMRAFKEGLNEGSADGPQPKRVAPNSRKAKPAVKKSSVAKKSK